MNDKHELTVRTWLTDDHKVVQEIGEMRRSIANVAAAQSEAKFREALIAMGWVPPEEAERLKDLVWRYEELSK